jgi:hypothetical protein
MYLTIFGSILFCLANSYLVSLLLCYRTVCDYDRTCRKKGGKKNPHVIKQIEKTNKAYGFSVMILFTDDLGMVTDVVVGPALGRGRIKRLLRIKNPSTKYP